MRALVPSVTCRFVALASHAQSSVACISVARASVALACALAVSGPAHADPIEAPSAETIASNIGVGDVSHCGHYRRSSALASSDVKDVIEVGIHMCENFGTKAHPSLSVEGRRWLASTTTCLMTDMDRAFRDPAMADAPVSSLLAYTADSHVACYVDNGFCELSLDDKRALLAVLDATAWRATPRLLPATSAIARSSVTMASACAGRALVD
jgi:hypothetical protein